MPNVITAGNSSNGGTAISTDTSGTLNIVTGSGSGANAITIDTSQVVTMPGTLAVTGAQTIGGNLTVTGSITGGSISVANSLKAWVNFNGTGTVAIRGSNNVTSITDGGVGVYTVNFTTAMTDANYVFSGIVTNFTGGFLSAVGMPAGGSLSTTSCLVNVEYSASGGTFYDPTYCLIAVFR
jgi:hypothetical protein